jgi:hypothetical protein
MAIETNNRTLISCAQLFRRLDINAALGADITAAGMLDPFVYRHDRYKLFAAHELPRIAEALAPAMDPATGRAFLREKLKEAGDAFLKKTLSKTASRVPAIAE